LLWVEGVIHKQLILSREAGERKDPSLTLRMTKSEQDDEDSDV